MPYTQAAETTYCTKLPAAETTVAAVAAAAASLVRVGLVLVGLVLLVRLRLLVLLVGTTSTAGPVSVAREESSGLPSLRRKLAIVWRLVRLVLDEGK